MNPIISSALRALAMTARGEDEARIREGLFALGDLVELVGVARDPQEFLAMAQDDRVRVLIVGLSTSATLAALENLLERKARAGGYVVTFGPGAWVPDAPGWHHSPGVPDAAFLFDAILKYARRNPVV